MDKAKKDYAPYEFFAWIDEYLKPRQTKTNLDPSFIDGSEEESEAEDNSLDRPADVDDSYTMHYLGIIHKPKVCKKEKSVPLNQKNCQKGPNHQLSCHLLRRNI